MGDPGSRIGSQPRIQQPGSQPAEVGKEIPTSSVFAGFKSIKEGFTTLFNSIGTSLAESFRSLKSLFSRTATIPPAPAPTPVKDEAQSVLNGALTCAIGESAKADKRGMVQTDLNTLIAGEDAHKITINGDNENAPPLTLTVAHHFYGDALRRPMFIENESGTRVQLDGSDTQPSTHPDPAEKAKIDDANVARVVKHLLQHCDNNVGVVERLMAVACQDALSVLAPLQSELHIELPGLPKTSASTYESVIGRYDKDTKSVDLKFQYKQEIDGLFTTSGEEPCTGQSTASFSSSISATSARLNDFAVEVQLVDTDATLSTLNAKEQEIQKGLVEDRLQKVISSMESPDPSDPYARKFETREIRGTKDLEVSSSFKTEFSRANISIVNSTGEVIPLNDPNEPPNEQKALERLLKHVGPENKDVFKQLVAMLAQETMSSFTQPLLERRGKSPGSPPIRPSDISRISAERLAIVIGTFDPGDKTVSVNFEQRQKLNSIQDLGPEGPVGVPTFLDPAKSYTNAHVGITVSAGRTAVNEVRHELVTTPLANQDNPVFE